MPGKYDVHFTNGSKITVKADSMSDHNGYRFSDKVTLTDGKYEHTEYVEFLWVPKVHVFYVEKVK